MSKPSTSSSSKPFQALIKECVLEWKHLKNLRKHFQFSVETKGWEIASDEVWGELPPLPRTWEVLGESLCLTTDYLVTKEKVAMANSRAEAAKVKGSRLRKDLVKAMDQVSEAKAKLKDISDQLRTERMLVIKKDKEIYFELPRRWTMKHHSKADDYSDLDYEAIRKEMMADEDAEGAKATGKLEREDEGEGLEDA
uniref:Uncharacterized protein n=1 Tax=Quercus lobata TaxID=97700 RepID=A0A7N2LYE7_QUELO